MDPLVLTFDIGTQSARAVLVDDKGNLLHKTQKKFDPPYFSLQPGWAAAGRKLLLETRSVELSLALKRDFRRGIGSTSATSA
jgi:predicted NBD/HSP70 family sugar kinase